ncbi:MAG: ABC transporter ATP-binding protein [Cetobacterium sp.]|uniref:ABC transporter ATP-binding protein n=2 Tax=Cetobacterium sp. TaxID=2071632 RepID=UPI0025E7FD67|nr:ABC transporter ATP-binding protein [uncultured Cetobacterium sp.]
MEKYLLEVENLKTEFKKDKKSLTAIEDVHFNIKKGETLGLVGESGSGKSVTAMSIMRLLETNATVNGKVLFEGENILNFSNSEMRKIRGGKIATIFQDPMSSLNPILKIKNQLMECTKLHLGFNKKEAAEHALNMLKLVGIPSPESVLDRFPHQLSGGMCQRVMIAMAMSCNPQLLIADEPTTALDVTIQAQIMELLLELKNKHDMGILLITHDLGVIAETCDKVIVMYAGRIMEKSTVDDLFNNPAHPYTKGLIASVPKLGSGATTLPYIEGKVPELSNMPTGCKFAPRCKEAKNICFEQEPKLIKFQNEKECRCHFVSGGGVV